MCIVRILSVLNLFFICLLHEFSGTSYSVQYFNNAEIWFDAHMFCYNKNGRLATNEDGLNCNQLTGSIKQGSTYWTGRYKTVSHWISKIGCYTIFGMPDSVTANSVSGCLEVCRKQHIQIKLLAHNGNKCVCLSENISSLRKIDQIRQCDLSRNSDNYWAYIVIRDTTLNGTGNCTFVGCQNEPEMKAYNCLTERTHFCDLSFRLNLTMSEEKCKHKIPRNKWDICNTTQTKNPGAWLPMHRVAFWTEVTSDDADMDTDVYATECQSFRCPTNAATQMPANISCSHKTNGFFCVFSSSNHMTSDRTKTLTDSAAMYPETFSYKSTGAHATDARTINVDIRTGTTSIIVKQKDNRNFTDITDHHTTSNIGLIVEGVLGALVIFGAVILVVMLRLRRKEVSTKNQNTEQIEIRNADHQGNNRSNNTRVNQLSEDEGARSDSPFPMRTKEAKNVNEQEGKRPNDVYAVVKKNNKPSVLQVELNSVVSSTEVVESEYDRLNITPKFLADNMENNLYDSSIAERCESDPTYNTATNIRHSRNNTKDVYN